MASTLLGPQQIRAVEAAIRRTSREIILPRFGRLNLGEVHEKAPGEIVTIADTEAERLLVELLTAIVPGSAAIGEELLARTPESAGILNTGAAVWIIDPIDGTENFLTGSSSFTCLVSLAIDGVLAFSWTYQPVADHMATAVLGAGAHLDGRALHVGAYQADLRSASIAVPKPRWWSEWEFRGYEALARRGADLHYFDTAGLAYRDLAAGRHTAMVLTWEHVWDHAAGLLLHSEAGGVTLTRDRQHFNIAGENDLPMVAAPTREGAIAIHSVLGSAADR